MSFNCDLCEIFCKDEPIRRVMLYIITESGKLQIAVAAKLESEGKGPQ